MTDPARLSTPNDMASRWRDLAVAIANAGPVRCDAESPKGNLVVLGSGLAHVDLTIDTELEIRSADHVFYCIYDRVTQVWISTLRPDAYDLTLLYDPQVDRYFTYIRMSEAMLHYVRQGKKVVAIYYGHPGVFAMPAHRAIAIARREGHQARMRPGISALDHLVADLGFDPALPGLLTFEATDMLLRRRRIDPTLHVVIWQVGVVGEFGYDPHGFENRGFDLLIDALEEVYGPDWTITHYLAPQYVGIQPMIDRHTIACMRKPAIRSRVNSLSTFYIEPCEATATDPERSISLGLSQPGQSVHPPERLYQKFDYGGLELAAVRGFDEFVPSAQYSMPQPTPGIRFMLELSRDISLQEKYRTDPVQAVNDPRFNDLSSRARTLLAMAHPLAINSCIAEEAFQTLNGDSSIQDTN